MQQQCLSLCRSGSSACTSFPTCPEVCCGHHILNTFYLGQILIANIFIIKEGCPLLSSWLNSSCYTGTIIYNIRNNISIYNIHITRQSNTFAQPTFFPRRALQGEAAQEPRDRSGEVPEHPFLRVQGEGVEAAPVRGDEDEDHDQRGDDDDGASV